MSEKKDMTCREAGRLGGLANAEKHDREHFVETGRKAGNVTLAKHGPEFYRRIGALGNAKVKALLAAGKAAAKAAEEKSNEVEP